MIPTIKSYHGVNHLNRNAGTYLFDDIAFILMNCVPPLLQLNYGLAKCLLLTYKYELLLAIGNFSGGVPLDYRSAHVAMLPKSSM